MTFLVGIDQGTSGTTVIVTDEEAHVHTVASRALPSIHGDNGSVEQDPWVVLQTVIDATGEAIDGQIGIGEATVVGFAHQGETVLAWEAETLRPLTPAIVWSDRRAQSVVDELAADGRVEAVESTSGMRLDPYFCGAKFRWLLDNHPTLASFAKRRSLRLGTLESWILAQLGTPTLTDAGTASRTQLVALGESSWHPSLLDVFGIDLAYLAPIVPSLEYRGDLAHPSWPTGLPLHASLVDQPAALIGAGGLSPGDLKVTYGTGAFVVANQGREKPRHQLDVVASVGWSDSVGPNFVLDGGVLSAGSALDWLEKVGVDTDPDAHEQLTGMGPSSVRVLPSLHGLGAPSWDRSAAAIIRGIRSNTAAADLLHGFIDGIAFRVKEIIDAMAQAGVRTPTVLRVDGGLSRSQYLMQMQANVLDLPVEVASTEEATALGAAMLAGEAAGILDLDALATRLRHPKRTYSPINTRAAQQAFASWQQEFDR